MTKNFSLSINSNFKMIIMLIKKNIIWVPTMYGRKKKGSKISAQTTNLHCLAVCIEYAYVHECGWVSVHVLQALVCMRASG